MHWGLASSGHTRTYMKNTSESPPECQGEKPTDGHDCSRPPFRYTEKDLEWLQLCFSPDRLAPYYVKSRGDHWVAFHLYVRNTELSASLYGVVQALEVGLRNLVHTKMTENLGTGEWWDRLPLHDGELEDIRKSKENLSFRISGMRPGQIVAELSFGFWVKMFANAYEKQLWVPHLRHRFPAKISRKMLHDRLTSIKDLRNRIAHHETLIKRMVERDYAELMETIGWISPTLQRWVEHHNDFPDVYARRIPKEPKQALPQGLEEPKARES
jgi:hypothetical protein